MRLDRPRLMLFFLVAGGFTLAAALVLSISRRDLHLSVTQWASRILELPGLIWWFAGTTVLSLWGLPLVLRLLRGLLSGAGNPSPRLQFPGRFGLLHSELYNAERKGSRSEKVQKVLRSLAVDLTALAGDIPEKVARQRVLRGEWTEDSVVKEYFARESSPGRRRRWQRLGHVLGRPKSSTFLQETEEAVRRLEAYGRFAHGSEKGGTTNGGV
jgi:hypothetical protein